MVWMWDEGSSQFGGRTECIDPRAAAIGVPALLAILDMPHPEQRLLCLVRTWEVSRCWIVGIIHLPCATPKKAPSLQRAMAAQMFEVVIHMPQYKVAGD